MEEFVLTVTVNHEDSDIRHLSELSTGNLKGDLNKALKIINQGYVHKTGDGTFYAYPTSRIISVNRIKK